MLTIVSMNRAGLNNGNLKVKLEFEFNEDSVLPVKSCSVGQKTYLIANGSTAKNITTNKSYEYKDGNWIKVVTTSENETTTKSNKITNNGDYNIPNNNSTGFSDVTVDVSAEPPVLIEKSITENGEYNASDDTADGYSKVTVNVSGGERDFRTQLIGGVCRVYQKRYNYSNAWSAKTWSGLTEPSTSRIWTDGENIYHSYQAQQYVLDRDTSTWVEKTWNVENLAGNCIWTDGENIYYTNGTNKYILDVSTSTWQPIPWDSWNGMNGNQVWTDGDNIYFSMSNTHKILDKSTHTWSDVTFSGGYYGSFYGENLWSDGNNIYRTDDNTHHYVLDKATRTWNDKTWTGLSSMTGGDVWSDGVNIYYSNKTNQYVLNKATSTWTAITWTGLPSGVNLYGRSIWTDGINIYYSNGSNQFVLGKSIINIPGLRP